MRCGSGSSGDLGERMCARARARVGALRPGVRGLLPQHVGRALSSLRGTPGVQCALRTVAGTLWPGCLTIPDWPRGAASQGFVPGHPHGTPGLRDPVLCGVPIPIPLSGNMGTARSKGLGLSAWFHATGGYSINAELRTWRFLFSCKNFYCGKVHVT